MIYAAENELFEAIAEGAPTGLVGQITFEVYDPTFPDLVIVAPRSSGITEVRPGTYFTTDRVLAAGTYHVRWRYLVGSDPFVAEEDLTVSNVATTARPSLSQVSLLLRTRTVGPASGGLGGDTGPGDVTVFTSTTRPTAAEVQDMIDMAMGLVVGRFGGADKVPANRLAQVQFAIAAYTALLIEQSFFREQSTAESRAWWSDLITTALEGVQDSVDDASPRPGFGTIGLQSSTRYASDNLPQEDLSPYVE